MRVLVCRACLTLVVGVLALPSLAVAQPIIPAPPDPIRIVGTVGKGPLMGTFRFVTSQEITGVKVLVSDLLDDGDGPLARDPIAASAVTVIPAIEGERLGAGVQQFAVQLSSPSEAGRWSGTLLMLWEKPEPGKLSVPILVTARSHPRIGLVAPQQLNFAGASGETIEFRFQVKETAKGSPTIGVKVLATDLRGTAGTKLLRADNIRPLLPKDTLAGGELMPVSVVVDLLGVESGKYEGQLMVTDAYHNDVSMPLEISVKDRWPLPLAVLVLGVFVGMFVSGYRARGRERDELIVRIESINLQVAGTGNLQKALKPLVQRIVVEVTTHITARNWEAAREAAGRAEALIGRWRGTEEAWLKALDGIENLRARLNKLSDAKVVRNLTRHLDNLDLAGLVSARALADEVHNGEDVIDFFERLQAQLEAIESEVEKLVSLEARRELGNTLEATRTELRDLNPADNQAAVTVASNVRTLAQRVRTAREKQEGMEREVEAFDTASSDMIRELGKPAASKAARSLSEVADLVLKDISSQESPDIRREHAENLWRGLWSGRTILRLVASEPKGVAAEALFGWLSQADSYAQSGDEFKRNLKALEGPVLTSWPAGTVSPTEPTPPRPPQTRGKGPSREVVVVVPGVSLADVGEDDGRAAAGRWAKFRSMFRAGDPTADARQSRLRLTLFRYSTQLLALVLLVWVGFTELYAVSPTFGAGGTKDYLVLFLWGFGAEATRSAVSEVVKGLLPAR